MKTLLTLMLSLAFVLPSAAQTRTVDVGDFTKLSLGIPANLYIKQGSGTKVEIECDDDLFDDIEIELRGDRLSISKDCNWGWSKGWRKSDVTIYVTMDEIEALSVSGSGYMESKGTLNTDEVRLSVSGSGDMELNLEGEEIDMRISGSGSIRLDGSADEAEASISGSGKVKAEDMTVRIFEAKISGSGSCYITATDEVEANISGSGSVYYAGEPKRVISNASGSGKIRKL